MTFSLPVALSVAENHNWLAAVVPKVETSNVTRLVMRDSGNERYEMILFVLDFRLPLLQRQYIALFDGCQQG